MARQNTGPRAWLEYKSLKLLSRPLAALSRKRAIAAGAALGSLAVKLDRINRPIAMRNLEVAFPEAPIAWRLDILRSMYRQFGRMAAEWLHQRYLTADNIANLVSYEGHANWDLAAEQSDGRGILVMTAHFGNFEMLPVAHALWGTPIALVDRPIRNPFLDVEVQRARCVAGNRVINRKGAGREILRLLKNKWMVAIALDLDVRDGVFVDFFSLKASTSASLARLAMATGAPVLPAFMVREGATPRHRITILPPIAIVRDGDRRAAITENTQRFTKAIEEMIRSHPDHWNWIHRRWKTRPPGEARFY